MNCPKCGQPNREGAKYCRACSWNLAAQAPLLLPNEVDSTNSAAPVSSVPTPVTQPNGTLVTETHSPEYFQQEVEKRRMAGDIEGMLRFLIKWAAATQKAKDFIKVAEECEKYGKLGHAENCYNQAIHRRSELKAAEFERIVEKRDKIKNDKHSPDWNKDEYKPDELEAIYDWFSSRDDVTGAVKFFERCHERRRTYVTALRWLARAYQRANQLDDAVRAMQSAVENSVPDKKPELYFELGNLELMRGDKRAAKEAFEKAGLQHAQARQQLASLRATEIPSEYVIRKRWEEMRNMGNYAQAAENFKRLIEFDPSVYYLHLYLAHAYEKMQDLDRAYEEQAKAAHLRGTDLGFVKLGQFCERYHRKETAEAYQKALDINPNNEIALLFFKLRPSSQMSEDAPFRARIVERKLTTPYLNSVWDWLKNKRWESIAVKYFTALAPAHSDFARLFWLLGQAYGETDIRMAVSAILYSADLSGTAEGYERAGDFCAQHSEEQKSVSELYRMASMLDPSDQNVKDKLQRLGIACSVASVQNTDNLHTIAPEISVQWKFGKSQGNAKESLEQLVKDASAANMDEVVKHRHWLKVATLAERTQKPQSVIWGYLASFGWAMADYYRHQRKIDLAQTYATEALRLTVFQNLKIETQEHRLLNCILGYLEKLCVKDAPSGWSLAEWHGAIQNELETLSVLGQEIAPPRVVLSLRVLSKLISVLRDPTLEPGFQDAYHCWIAFQKSAGRIAEASAKERLRRTLTCLIPDLPRRADMPKAKLELEIPPLTPIASDSNQYNLAVDIRNVTDIPADCVRVRLSTPSGSKVESPERLIPILAQAPESITFNLVDIPDNISHLDLNFKLEYFDPIKAVVLLQKTVYVLRAGKHPFEPIENPFQPAWAAGQLFDSNFLSQADAERFLLDHSKHARIEWIPEALQQCMEYAGRHNTTLQFLACRIVEYLNQERRAMRIILPQDVEWVVAQLLFQAEKDALPHFTELMQGQQLSTHAKLLLTCLAARMTNAYEWVKQADLATELKNWGTKSPKQELVDQLSYLKQLGVIEAGVSNDGAEEYRVKIKLLAAWLRSSAMWRPEQVAQIWFRERQMQLREVSIQVHESLTAWGVQRQQLQYAEASHAEGELDSKTLSNRRNTYYQKRARIIGEIQGLLMPIEDYADIVEILYHITSGNDAPASIREEIGKVAQQRQWDAKRIANLTTADTPVEEQIALLIQYATSVQAPPPVVPELPDSLANLSSKGNFPPPIDRHISIFISYARKDKERVHQLYQQLFALGFNPWMDTENILAGKRWEKEIEHAIRESDFFLACISVYSSTKEGTIVKEIREALEIRWKKFDRDNSLIPVRLEECEMPDVSFKDLTLKDFQWIDLYEPGGMDRLVKALEVGSERKQKK